MYTCKPHALNKYVCHVKFGAWTALVQDEKEYKSQQLVTDLPGPNTASFFVPVDSLIMPLASIPAAPISLV